LFGKDYGKIKEKPLINFYTLDLNEIEKHFKKENFGIYFQYLQEDNLNKNKKNYVSKLDKLLNYKITTKRLQKFSF